MLFLATLGLVFAPTALAPGDALAEAFERWNAQAAAIPADDEFWKQVQPGSASLLERTQGALAKERRSLALLTLAYAIEDVSAMSFVLAHATERADLTAFERLWQASSRELDDAATKALLARAKAIRPALPRAIAEAAVTKLGVYVGASVEYGKSTTPESGLYYLGSAYAQRDVLELCERLSTPDAAVKSPARPLAGELDRLDADLIAIYRPPLSLDRHSEFIVAAGTLKEARELDAAGLFDGALLRYLQARQRFAAFGEGAAPTADELATRVRTATARLDAVPLDHGIARVFRERAEETLEAGTPEIGALALVALEAYVDALAKPQTVGQAAQPDVTVTLVRWPYT